MASAANALDRPIILLGAARSGTTALCEALRFHPDVAVWEEPKHIWRFGDAYRRDDRRVAADATPRVAGYIREQFARYLRRAGRSRFAEKTPSNCYRVSFIREVFPDARFIHLIRDGRAVTVSAMHQWRHDYVGGFGEGFAHNSSHQAGATGEATLGSRVGNALRTVQKFVREKQRFTGGVATLFEAPAYVPDLLRVFRRKLSGGRASYVWGPKFPGIHEFHRTHTLAETCAEQWLTSVRSVLDDARQLPGENYLEIRFEDVVADPRAAVARIAAFAQLRADADFERNAARLLTAGSPQDWTRAVSAEDAQRIEARLAPMLTRLGYPTTAAPAAGASRPRAAASAFDAVPLPHTA